MKLLNPTEHYIKKINPKFNEWDSIDKMSKKISLEERQILGLCITKKEYKDLFEKVENSLNELEQNTKILTKK